MDPQAAPDDDETPDRHVATVWAVDDPAELIAVRRMLLRANVHAEPPGRAGWPATLLCPGYLRDEGYYGCRLDVRFTRIYFVPTDKLPAYYVEFEPATDDPGLLAIWGTPAARVVRLAGGGGVPVRDARDCPYLRLIEPVVVTGVILARFGVAGY